MQKMKKYMRYLRKHIITIWLVISIVTLCGLLVYAKFGDGQNYAKRVVATGTNDKVLFTSNLLNTSNSGHPKSVSTGYSSNSTYDINIYNYDRTKPSSYYPGTINFKLKVMLVHTDGTNTVYDLSDSGDLAELRRVLITTTTDEPPVTEYHTIDVYRLVNGEPETNPILTVGAVDSSTINVTDELTQQLVPGTTGSAVNSYRVVLPKEVIDSDIHVKIVAEPTGHSDLPTSIGGVFYVQSQNIVVTNGWKGEFIDNRSIAPSGYDAFNFRISGAGTETKVLKWNNTYVQPNKQQITELFGDSSFSSSTNEESHVFPITAGVYAYDIQFYVNDKAARDYIDGLSWDQLIAANIVYLDDPT